MQADGYETSYVEDAAAGSAGLELHRASQGKKERIASVLFWDASGQFFVQTFGTDVPVQLIEKLIADAKNRVKTN